MTFFRPDGFHHTKMPIPLLKKTQIRKILDEIPLQKYIPAASAESVRSRIRSELERQLKKIRLKPEKFEQFKDEIVKKYNHSIATAGESVGILCAQSIGQMNTQMTLNSFHHAGISEAAMTAGVPKFQELLSATQNPKIVNSTVYFIKRPQSLEEIIQLCSGKFKALRLRDITSDWSKTTDANGASCVEFSLDWKMLYRFGVYPQEVVEKLAKISTYEVCMARPLSDAFKEDLMPIIRVSFDELDSFSVSLHEVPKLQSYLVSGIEEIDHIFYEKYVDQDGDEEWFVRTVGCNFQQICLTPGVDTERTISNNVWDIYKHLGIEAAREALLHEFTSIMGSINSGHTQILIDRMTYDGIVRSISRYTLKKENSSVFGKASFEESLENFIQASVSGAYDSCTGNSASIVCGKKSRAGTGFFDLKLDLEAIRGRNF